MFVGAPELRTMINGWKAKGERLTLNDNEISNSQKSVRTKGTVFGG